MRTGTTWAALLLTTAVCARGGDGPRTGWTFEADSPGAAPRGFTPAVGTWDVVATPGGKVLAQTASSANKVFNVILADAPTARDVDLSVKVRAVAGELDRGGGLVWRARDPRNYYVARYNHLEDNLRVYKVVDGVRSKPLGNADIPRHDGWTTLRVTMRGDHIRVDLDGTRYLDLHDPTFPDAGKVGLWSKADARSQFDDLSLAAE